MQGYKASKGQGDDFNLGQSDSKALGIGSEFNIEGDSSGFLIIFQFGKLKIRD